MPYLIIHVHDGECESSARLDALHREVEPGTIRGIVVGAYPHVVLGKQVCTWLSAGQVTACRLPDSKLESKVAF